MLSCATMNMPTKSHVCSSTTGTARSHMNGADQSMKKIAPMCNASAVPTISTASTRPVATSAAERFAAAFGFA